MANHTSLSSLFTDIANAIRAKLGSSGRIVADNFPAAIQSIPTGSAPVLETVTKSYTPTETAQSDTITPGTGYDAIEEVDVTVGAIPDDYVGSAVPRRTSSDLTANAGTVSAPAGYYASGVSKAVPSGTEGTPTATKGAVSNHAVTVTPSVQNSAGYIPGGTRTGTGVRVSASELVSGTLNIDSSGTKDVTDYASVDVPSASPFMGSSGETYVTESGLRRWKANVFTEVNVSEGDTEGWLPDGYHQDFTFVKPAVPSNTSITPTESAQTVGGANYMMEGPVTVNAIPSNYVGSGVPQKSSSDLTASGGTVSAPAGYYPNGASKAVQSGTEGTPTATKGPVSNHAVTVTPAVTNAAGYIQGGTHSGAPVTVRASELVSGSETLSDNGTYDVTNLAEVVVEVQGGGGGGTQVATKTATPSAASSSIQFTGLSGNPTSFVVTSQADIATNTNGVTAIVFDGSSLHGQKMTTQVEADTGFTKSYSNGTLTITATSAQFQANAYKLIYTYGGSASDIETADVQVGSGATSITFPVNGRPAYWSCIFKSDFSTSSGYQRVIAVANDGSSTYGLAMDSSAHAQTSWTASYSGGNFTINSQSTNNGGYFHQPGYYQLTYYVDPSAPSYQSKTVTPTKSIQNVTPDSGFDALSQVTVNAIPSEYIVPTGNLPITQNGNNIDVSQYATVSVNVGGGGSSMNAQSAQSTTRATSTSYTEVIALTCAASGTYDVYWSTFRSSTSGTWGSQLYIDNTAYGSAQTGSWSNHIQNIHLTNVQIDAGEEVAVRVRSRGSNYYGYVGTLTIIQKS